MKWMRLIVLAGVLLVWTGCGQGAETNRIFSNLVAETPVAPVGPALVVSVPEVVAEPEVYAGALLRITAQFRRAPVVVCGGVTRSSPRTWMLGQGEQLLAARGHEEFVVSLLPPRLRITVEGVLRHWRGPVGCGKDAPVQDVWYLAVTEIVSPNPIARVTLTPEGQAPQATPSPGGETPIVTATTQESEPVETPATTPASSPTPRPSGTPRPATATSQASPTSGTPDPSASVTASPTPEATGDGTAVPSATVTATAENGATFTPSATPGNGDATATPTRTVVDMGSLAYQTLHGGPLDSSEMHSWQFEVRAGDVITASVAAGPDADLTLAVLDPAGNRLVEQDQGGPGQVERIEGLEAASSGGYRLLVAEAEAAQGDYLVMLLNDNYVDYYEVVFIDLLSYGSPVTGNLPEDIDHFWFFSGNAGDVINVNVSPGGDADLFFDLYGTDGSILADFVDEAPGGSAEQLLNFDLPATGLYAIGIGENFFDAATYTVLVAQN